MKKKIILILILIIELILIKIPPYVELNNIAIIEDIAVEKRNNHYTIILKETIPIKGDQGISYKYKYYKKTASSIEKAYNYLKKETKKKLYLKKAKSLYTNIKTSKEILKKLNIKPNNIIHTNKNLYNELKES